MGVQEDFNDFEAKIEKLKFEYDQYFLGFSKIPPEKLRKEIERLVRKYLSFKSPNTGFRFRAQNLVQRVTTYRQLWDRTLQQIEDGTYRRDVARSKLHDKFRSEAPGAAPEPGHHAHDEVIEDAEMFEEEDQAPKPKWSGVFDQYLKARTETREGIVGLSYDKLHDVLEKQAAQIKAKFNAKDVDFRVVIEDGKARLKATPKK
jgi:hypothetical protein